MQGMRRQSSVGGVLGLFVVLVCWPLVLPTGLYAQICTPSGAQGNNAVYNTACYNGSPGILGSPAFIDAKMFIDPTHTNICAALNNILSHFLPGAGAVIDARGITGATALACADSPWAGIAASPSTILLPAGVIQIPTTWTLPDGTKIIGVGAGGFEGPNETLVSTTTLKACNNPPQCTGFSGSAMIQMCNSGVCHSVGIEDLSLDGRSISGLNGIVNAYSRELSYVNRVNLYNVLGYGLKIQGSAQNSGPYTNIIYNTSGSVGSGCVQIEGVPTRGIHGLTCESAPDSSTAIFLDASNNSLEDLRIVGFYDGVLIGSQQSATSDVLRNIYGDTSKTTLAPVYVIHIASNPNNNIADIAMMGVANAASGSGTTTIKDELTGATLQDPYVSMYALGEKTPSGGYPRFTTSPNAATWAVGTVGISGNSPTCSVPGSLYSNENASSGQPVLWLCVKVSGGNEWQIVD